MRISQDTDSWRADGVIRRDTRARRDTPETPRPRNRKANRRRWCRGRVGVDHQLVFDRHEAIRTLTVIGDGRWVTNIERRSRYRCKNCGMPEHSSMPAHVHAQVHPVWADHIAARERWCSDGHLYDTVVVNYLWQRTIRVCVMCGWSPDRGRPLDVAAPVTLAEPET